MPTSVLEREANAHTQHPTHMAESATLRLRFREGEQERIEEVELPRAVWEGLDSLLEAHAQGKTVALLASEEELSPNDAAQFLGVSRPHLVKLLDEGRIAFRRVGAHRRIRASELRAFRDAEEARGVEAMAKLQAQAQELKMGY